MRRRSAVRRLSTSRTHMRGTSSSGSRTSAHFRRRMSTTSVRRSLALLVVLLTVPGAATAAAPSLHFTEFAQTDLPLGQAPWTGREWLWNAENLGRIEVADANGLNVRSFAAFDQGGEEMRCAVPPNGLWPDGVYCHTPDNRLVRLNRDGT